MFSRRQSSASQPTQQPPPPPPSEAESSRRSRWDAREPSRDQRAVNEERHFERDYRERDRRDERREERRDDREFGGRGDDYGRRRDDRDLGGRGDEFGRRRDDRDLGGRGEGRRNEYRDDYRRESYSRGDSRDHNRDRRDRNWNPRRRSVSPQERVNAVPLEQRPRSLNNWDAAPPGFEKISADKAKLTGLFPPPGNVAKIANFSISNLDSTKAALLTRITGSGHAAAHDASSAIQSLGSNTRAQRRIYVGGIPMMAGEDDLTTLFNRLVGRNSGLDPVLAVQIAQDHSYAFIEFRTPEQATQAIELDGTPFQDVTLRIRRPKEYTQAQQPEYTASSGPTVAMHTLPAPSEPNQLILSGFPLFLSEDHLRQMALPFGELKFFRLLADPIGEDAARSMQERSYGAAVLEFVDHSDGEGFYATLNQLAMGESYTLSVQRLEDCEADYMMMQTLSKFGLAPGSICADRSRILLMLNAIGMDDLLDDERYANLETDLRLSMEPFGQIVGLVVPRPMAGQALASVGRIFIEYDTEEAVDKAIASISGKSFADRLVLAIPYPEDRFRRGIY